MAIFLKKGIILNLGIDKGKRQYNQLELHLKLEKPFDITNEAKEPLIADNDDLLIVNVNNSIPPRIYEVEEYDELCEEYSQVESITPIAYSGWKIAVFVLLNILTLCLIDLFVIWFPQLKLKLLYSHVSIQKAQYLAVVGVDKELYVIEMKEFDFPSIPTSFLKSQYATNLPRDSKVAYFVFKLFTYIYLPNKDAFSAYYSEVNTSYENIHQICSRGLNDIEARHQVELHGLCDLQIEINSFMKILLLEASDPFYIFQVFSVVLWMCNQYEAYAGLIIFATTVSLLISSYETRKNLLSIQQMARYACEVNVYRRNSKGELAPEPMSSINLVPGDLFEIPQENLAMPCDCILINGTVIVNEAMLTGESTPIIKSNIPRIESAFNPKNEKKKFLFAGTTVIQKRTHNNEKALAIVYSTGFNTSKGNLIRSILFPKKIDFKFKNDSVKYIYLMACISFVGFGISVPFLIEANLTISQILKKSLDLITTTVPPSLPACLGIGISYAMSRLQKYGIICINRERVNVSGKVNMICFDKTGTLTEDHLDIFGYRPVLCSNDTHFLFDSFKKEAIKYSQRAYTYYKAKRSKEIKDRNEDLNELYVECLACCHGATLVNGNLIGDPIDVKMFQACDWELYETDSEANDAQDCLISTYVRPKQEKDLNTKIEEMGDMDDEDAIFREHYELGIVRRFDFSSKLQRMSVIAKDVNDKHYKLFCKGSPEKIKELCRAETIPANFNDQLMKYTSKGLRVLAMGMKMIKMDYVQSQQISREKAESNMLFLGLLIVQNKLKLPTTESIEILDEAGIRMVMATGDNILTAISVSKECKLIGTEAVVYCCEIEKNALVWKTIENFKDEDEDEFDMVYQENQTNFDQSNKSLLDKFPPERYTLKWSRKNSNSDKVALNPFAPSRKHSSYMDDEDSLFLNIEVSNYPFDQTEDDNFIIAMTGPTFESLLKLNNKFKETGEAKYKQYNDVFKLILRHCYIFARMAPEHKTMLVESLRAENLTVLMCGDGANDCGALRAADIGVSLSQEEASIAAHFTSKKSPDISCLIKLLREGKASLVTSIQTFKYMMIYSIIQFGSVTLLMIKHSYLTDYQFLATDVFIIFPLAFFIAKTGAYHKLTSHQPTDSLISFPIISSILLQTIIAIGFQFGAWAFMAYYAIKDYTNECGTNGNEVLTCKDNTVIYLISNMQYLITAFAFSISKPFRKPIYTNVFLTCFMLFAFAYSIYIIISPDVYSSDILQIFPFELDFKLYMLGFCFANFLLSYLTEGLIVPLLSLCWSNLKIKQLQKMVQDSAYDYNLDQLQHIKNQVKRNNLK